MHRMFSENKREAKGSKFKSCGCVGVVSPLMNVASSRSSSYVFDRYASDSSNSPSPLMKFLRSADPMTAGHSSPAFVTPVKVVEDVIVMDEISVPKTNKGIGEEVRMRSPLMSLNSVNRSFGKSDSTVPSSPLPTGNDRLAENRIFIKNELCRSWENSGTCQCGSHCQFAHGKEELRYLLSSRKMNLEISKLTSSSGGSSPPPRPSPLSPPPYGPKFHRNSQFKAAEAAAAEEAFPASPIAAKQLSGISAIPNATTLPLSDWSPLDDGIDVTLPLKEEENAYIWNFLYGNRPRKRLPVFEDLDMIHGDTCLEPFDEGDTFMDLPYN